ncbi:hypothetical protein E2C01_032412 [Portunus trituberculatus]|uniref:Uncharacterized protein n=1 Tax=Portunus trituberculatus TaxID=210409 RepID=A0A5B7EZJ7_PORTR|nr:hypothetical protein [Portunus trituberculatus]
MAIVAYYSWEWQMHNHNYHHNLSQPSPPSPPQAPITPRPISSRGLFQHYVSASPCPGQCGASHRPGLTWQCVAGAAGEHSLALRRRSGCFALSATLQNSVDHICQVN